MKKSTIFAAILAAALLTGCGEEKPLGDSSSSSSSTTSSSSSSTASSSLSTSSSTTSSSTSSSTTSSSSSLSTSSTSTSSSTASSSSTAESSTSSSELVPDWYPGSTTSSSSTTPKPTPTPNPTQSSSSSSSFSSPTTDPITKYWDPTGCTPGPYGGYYDASGKLHCKKANMPYDDKGYPVKSYIDEYGDGYLTYAEMQEYIEEERRIAAGGEPDDGDFDWSRW